MPWTTPTLRAVRQTVRDDVTAALNGAVLIGNSVLRVMSDAMAGLAHLTLRYIDWLSRQLLPDTAEREWLDRHGDIWLVNADNSVGRKAATYSAGSATMTGLLGTVVPSGTQLSGGTSLAFETTEEITLGAAATPVAIRALNAGAAGNLEAGDYLSFDLLVPGVDGSARVVELSGGTDQESDDDLRTRVLFRIQQPPMGGAAHDYVAWALAVPGVTRAWASTEMGLGTTTVRVMCDDLRADNDGFPTEDDLAAVRAYIDQKRPVAVKDCFVESPIPYPVDITINDPDWSAAVKTAVEVAIADMLHEKAKPAHMVDGVQYPAQTIYAVWITEAAMSAAGVDYFEYTGSDVVMPNNGSIAVLGTIFYT